jgi:hypothetical protein
MTNQKDGHGNGTRQRQEQRQQKQQIPFGDDNKQDNSNCKSNNGKA